MDKKTITIIILSLILFGVAGVYGYAHISNTAYQEGFNDANIFIFTQIKTNLDNYGFITFNYPINENETFPIKLIPYIE